MSDVAIYENGTVTLKATVEDESVWLNQNQMEELFGRERSVISKHIRNIFKEDELDEKVVSSILEHSTEHGAIAGKIQTKDIIKNYTY